MKNLLKLIIVTVLCSTNLNAKDFQSLFSSNTLTKENYILVDEIGMKKLIIPFHYDKTTTNFNAKDHFFLIPKLVRSVEYIYCAGASDKRQLMLNNARVDTLISLFGPKMKGIDAAVFSTIVLSNDHKEKSQFTGFIITVELSSKENSLLMEKILDTESDDKLKATFCLDTILDYGYILPHIPALHTLDEYSVVQRCLKRNKWKNKLIVLDVTGSMTPYIGQYLLWLNLNFKAESDSKYVFFNDGNDNKGFNKKTIGATGGVYFCNNPKSMETVADVIKAAVRNGSGGDLPENNIEAILKGQHNFPNAKNIIMIADNQATPRDLELVKKLKKPVHIILCGTSSGYINIAYLNLAYETKGTIHSIESDLNDLIKKKEGDIFWFLGVEYLVKSGKIIEIY